MAQIRFVVNGDVQLSRNLRIAANQIQNLEWFFSDALNIVEDKSDSIWSSWWTNVEKSPKWKQLAPSTLRARANWWWYYWKVAPSNPWLMRWSWNLQNNKTKTVTKNSWILSYNASYAWYHQDWWRSLPRRAIIDLDNWTNDKIVKSLQKTINDIIWIFWKQV